MATSRSTLAQFCAEAAFDLFDEDLGPLRGECVAAWLAWVLPFEGNTPAPPPPPSKSRQARPRVDALEASPAPGPLSPLPWQPTSEAKMTRRLTKRKTLAAGDAMLAFAGALLAQAPGITRTLVTKADVSVPGREAVVAGAGVAAGGVAGWRTHPGDAMSYVMDGEATLLVAGQPPGLVKAGEGFVIPAGVVHNAQNDNTAPIRLVDVYVVEKGKPLAAPAPAH